ncbi:MAG TPA: hypothetical protein VFV94_00555 [Polyangiaceae bacterium]|nr:hypothetical protein [Polyangiaceae bacterium]
MLKNLVWGLVVGSALVAGVGCGGSSGDDDDASGGSSNGNPEAVAQCNDFKQVYCTAIVDCLVESQRIDTSARDANVDACVGAAKDLDCARAAAVSSNYDACITAIATPDCTVVNAAFDAKDASGLVPEVCYGVILLYP